MFLFQVRNFSTSNIGQQLVKPPIQVFGLDGRYATALYSAASKQKTLEAVEKDLINFQQSLKTDSKLKEYILNPTVQRTEKSKAIKEIATKIKLNPQTANLLQLLAENGRLKNYDGVANAFKTIMAAHRGEVRSDFDIEMKKYAGCKSLINQISVQILFVKHKYSDFGN